MLLSSLKARLAATSLLFSCQLVISKQWVTGRLKRRRIRACSGKGGWWEGVREEKWSISWRLPSSPGASGWRKRWGQQSWGMPAPGHTAQQRPRDVYTWAHVHLGMCAVWGVQAMAMAGVRISSVPDQWQKFLEWKIPESSFQNTQVKALWMTSITNPLLHNSSKNKN